MGEGVGVGEGEGEGGGEDEGEGEGCHVKEATGGGRHGGDAGGAAGGEWAVRRQQGVWQRNMWSGRVGVGWARLSEIVCHGAASLRAHPR